MADSGNLQADALFLGLTRPTTILGVHYLLFLFNFMFAGLLFINLNTDGKLWQIPLLGIIIHLFLYLVCLKEMRMIEILLVRFGKCTKCKNRSYHKFTNSYDLD